VQPTRANRFEVLFREHYPAVRAYASRRATEELAQDVIAETFLIAWRRFDELPADPLPWLYGVARRVLANQRRSAGRGEALERKLAFSAPPDVPGDLAEQVGDAELMRLALARLSEHDREALMLVAWEGLEGARAARSAGCSRGAFAVRLHRARSRLAAELGDLERPTVRPNPMEASP
jgi:RNA polymerase sigma-70 factor, ECF subfamily